jgi:hypothetical protein
MFHFQQSADYEHIISSSIFMSKLFYLAAIIMIFLKFRSHYQQMFDVTEH